MNKTKARLSLSLFVFVVFVITLFTRTITKKEGTQSTESEKNVQISSVSYHSFRLVQQTIIDNKYYKEKVFKQGDTSFDRSSSAFYFHIGPGKTGTTTLNMNIQNSKDLLKKDGYLCVLNDCNKKYITTKTEQKVKSYQTGIIISEREQETEDIGFILQQLKDQQNVIMQTEGENVATYFIEALKSHDIHIHLTINHRLFHERIYSYYTQKHKMFWKHIKIENTWPSIETLDEVNGLEFVDYVNNMGPKHMRQAFTTDGRIEKMLQLIANAERENDKFHADISVIDVHNPNHQSVTYQYFCNIFPNAERTCNKEKELTEKSEEIIANNSHSKEQIHKFISDEYDHFIVAAYKAGMFNASLCKYQHVVQKVHEYIQSQPDQSLTEVANKDKCLRTKYKESFIENALKDKDLYYTGSDVDFDTSFAKIEENFCDYDYVKILNESKKWRTFFREMSLTCKEDSAIDSSTESLE